MSAHPPSAPVRDELDVQESERGFRVSVNGRVDPARGVPWLSVALVLAGILPAVLVHWTAGAPFVAIALALTSPVRGPVIYGLAVEHGKLELLGVEEVPLHRFDRVEVSTTGLDLVGEGNHPRLDLEGTPAALAWLGARIQAAIDAQGDESQVPEALARLQETEGAGA